MPVSWDQGLAAGGQVMPSAPMLPMQVPGGTQEEAAKAQQELTKQSAGEEQTRYTQRGQLAEQAAGPLARYIQTLKNAGPDPVTGEEPDIFGTSYVGQLAGYGATDAASKFRQHAIKVHSPGWQKFQDWENLGGSVDSANNDATLALQSMYRTMGRGGGQTGQEGAAETLPRGNLPILQGILGNRQANLRSQLLEKVKQPVADIFQNMGEAVEHNQYSTRQAVEALSPFGFTQSQIVAGLKAKTSPWHLKPAGGAIDANRDGSVAGAAGPLPGDGGNHGDNDGEAPPPRSTPGRLRPGKQAGFAGQGSDSITNRQGMEPMETGQEMPPVPKDIDPRRAAQWNEAVQILFKHPESAPLFNQRYSPGGMSGRAEGILKKYRPRGFDQ